MNQYEIDKNVELSQEYYKFKRFVNKDDSDLHHDVLCVMVNDIEDQIAAFKLKMELDGLEPKEYDWGDDV